MRGALGGPARSDGPYLFDAQLLLSERGGVCFIVAQDYGAASHATARRCELRDVFEELADRFHEIRLALNRLSDQLLNLDDDSRPQLAL